MIYMVTYYAIFYSHLAFLTLLSKISYTYLTMDFLVNLPACIYMYIYIYIYIYIYTYIYTYHRAWESDVSTEIYIHCRYVTLMVKYSIDFIHTDTTDIYTLYSYTVYSYQLYTI